MTQPNPTPQPATDTTPNGPAGAAITLEHVNRTYRTGTTEVRALDDLTLQLPTGIAAAIMGASGSGKSTLLHLLGAMDTPTTGTITVNGTHVETLDARQAPLYRQRIGFVFQRFHLLPALSALDNILMPLLPHHPHRRHAEHKARQLLERVGLPDRAQATPAELSGGEQQRIAIARALIGDPILILADEPTGNLDATTGHNIFSLLLQLHTEQTTTLLVATHDPAIAARCDTTIHLTDGHLATPTPAAP